MPETLSQNLGDPLLKLEVLMNRVIKIAAVVVAVAAVVAVAGAASAKVVHDDGLKVSVTR